jgi:coenzyme F420-reducing hydrogenase beta subunit
MSDVNISALQPNECCGCTACFASCPVNAIEMKPDFEGFLYPRIDPDLCIDCGKCLNVCLNIKLYKENQTIYSCRSSDELRARSSSGGVFSRLAEIVLDSGGGVCAVGYSDGCTECLHKIITTKDELDDLRRAKFVQSKKYDIYSQLKTYLDAGKLTLFCGTPCECGGLRQYLDKEYDNLLTCDLICGCVSSPDVYQRYIKFLNDKYDSEIVSVNFKDKRQGWRGKAIAVNFANGTDYYNSILDDDYCVSFHSRYNIRPSCFNCKYRSLERSADLTLGDFWAIEKYAPKYDDNKGTSFILANTQKGVIYLHEIVDMEIVEMDIELEDYATKYNWCLHKNPTGMPDDARRTFYEDVHTMPFDKMALKNLEEIKQIRKQKKLNTK